MMVACRRAFFRRASLRRSEGLGLLICCARVVEEISRRCQSGFFNSELGPFLLTLCTPFVVAWAPVRVAPRVSLASAAVRRRDSTQHGITGVTLV